MAAMYAVRQYNVAAAMQQELQSNLDSVCVRSSCIQHKRQVRFDHSVVEFNAYSLF